MCVDLSFECVLFSVSKEILSKEACHRNVTYRALSWLCFLCLKRNVVVIIKTAIKRAFLRRWPALASAVACILLARLLLLPIFIERVKRQPAGPFRRNRHGVNLERNSPLVVRERRPNGQVSFLVLAGLAVFVGANSGDNFVSCFSHGARS